MSERRVCRTQTIMTEHRGTVTKLLEPIHNAATRGAMKQAIEEHQSMVADVFGLHVRTPTESEIDRGAKALREKQMAGRITRAWDTVPKSDQKKWREHAEVVLRAAFRS